ncbi:MAG: FAD-binding oxidoreductase [Myxococcota bacterium]
MNPNESALDCLERHGVAITSRCRSGICQSCMMHVVDGEIPEGAQHGLKPTWRDAGLVLICQSHPTSDLHLALPGAFVQETQVKLVEKTWLSSSVVRLRWRPLQPLSYRPGQFIHLRRPSDGLMRSYSLASVPGVDDHLELHVRQEPHGQMSGWLAEALNTHDTVTFRGPSGDCVYTCDDPTAPIVMIGVGTGLAPLWGVLRDALHQGHTGPITLYHAGRTPDRLYMRDALNTLAHAHMGQVTIHACVLENPDAGCRQGHLEELVMADRHPWADAYVLLCGDPGLVKSLKKRCFLAGASLSRIAADPFVGANALMARD